MKKLAIVAAVLVLGISALTIAISEQSNRRADAVIAEVDRLTEENTNESIEYVHSDSVANSDPTVRYQPTIEKEIEPSYTPTAEDVAKAREYAHAGDSGQADNDDTWNSDVVPDNDRTLGEEVEEDAYESEYTDVDSSADYSGDTWVDAEADTYYSESVIAMTPPQTDVYYGFVDDEVYEIARIVWLEVGICGCSYYTQYLTACVILNRYLDWGYASLYDTIHASGQYATADMYTEYDGSSIRIGERTWSAVYDALANTDRNPHYQMRGGHDMRVYYWDADWDVCFYY